MINDYVASRQLLVAICRSTTNGYRQIYTLEVVVECSCMLNRCNIMHLSLCMVLTELQHATIILAEETNTFALIVKPSSM